MERRLLSSLTGALTAALLLGAMPAIAHRAHEQKTPRSDAVADAAEPSESPMPEAGITRWLGRLHPSTVHFPIALLTAAFFSELTLLTSGSQPLRDVTRFCVALGAAGALVSAPLGWLFAAEHAAADAELLELHRIAGTATAIAALATLAASEHAARRETSRRMLRVLLTIATAGVLATGFLGRSLIYGLDHLSWRPL